MSDSLHAKKVQRELAEWLKCIFSEDMVKVEWRSQSGAEDWLKFKGIYAPRPDIAVGPFNITPGCHPETDEINNAFRNHNELFHKLGITVPEEDTNQNPRCLIAIEIEDSNKGKHMLGNIVNASLLGKVGMIVTLKDEFLRAAMDVAKFLRCAHKIGKTQLRISNVLVCSWRELEKRLKSVLSED